MFMIYCLIIILLTLQVEDRALAGVVQWTERQPTSRRPKVDRNAVTLSTESSKKVRHSWEDTPSSSLSPFQVPR